MTSLPDTRDAANDPPVRPGGVPELSLVAPAHDEAPNLEPLHRRIREVFDGRLRIEIVLVDDGSTDGTPDVIRDLVARDPRVRGIVLAARSGQTAAMVVGIRAARAPLIATLDADLQNDPGDLLPMLEALDGHDAVVGWRTQRCDSLVKRVTSRVGNRLRDLLTRDRVRDTGCSLKLFRAEAIRSLPMYDGMHRFLPTLLRQQGWDVIEHPVGHAPRTAGRSKYGTLDRAARGVGDVLAVAWMGRRTLRTAERERIEGDAPPE
ncbi:MAG: glycosyltransferase family 2 protein [Planctomycetota bacterium]|jgi:glycosyltransferase involved in cell wall biosynthesis